MFYRAYLSNDSGTKRGATAQHGGIKPHLNLEIWFNPDTGMILEKANDKLSTYCYTKIQGDETFKVFFFDNIKESKTFTDFFKPLSVKKKVTKKTS